MTSELSAVQQFFCDSTVLITGGSGFLGKVLIEKLLRACPQLRQIVLLMRAKRGTESWQRLDKLLDGSVFKGLSQESRKRVSVVAGDCQLLDLGLSNYDRQYLIDNVDVVFHVAASIRFDEDLASAVATNVAGTKAMLDLARDMTKLKAFVHVSTAFSNCDQDHVSEKFYPAKYDPERLMRLTEVVDEPYLSQLTPLLLDRVPNTYIYTKAAAEDLVRTHSRGLPVSVFRPSIGCNNSARVSWTETLSTDYVVPQTATRLGAYASVSTIANFASLFLLRTPRLPSATAPGKVVSAKSEPEPGWTDNLYGATGLLVPTISGALRTVCCDEQKTADLVPVDMVANALIATAWKTHSRSIESGTDIEPTVFNFVSSPERPLQWNQFIGRCLNHHLPSVHTMWVPWLWMTKYKALYRVLHVVLHILPAYTVDTTAHVFSVQSSLLKITRRVERLADVLEYFMTRDWTFSNLNTQKLWLSLSPQDRQLFPFSFAEFNWDNYFKSFMLGVRQNLLKDDLSTLPRATTRLKRLSWVNRALQVTLLFTTFRLIYFFFNLTSASYYLTPYTFCSFLW